jgi:hypothetical protein
MRTGWSAVAAPGRKQDANNIRPIVGKAAFSRSIGARGRRHRLLISIRFGLIDASLKPLFQHIAADNPDSTGFFAGLCLPLVVRQYHFLGDTPGESEHHRT